MEPFHLSNIKAVLFDLDGVLVDSYHSWWEMLNDALRSRGRAPLTQKEFNDSWGQGPEADREKFFPEWTLEQLLQFYHDNFQRYLKWSKFEPEALPVLKELNEKGKMVGVASNSPRFIITNLLEEAGLATLVHSYVGVDEVKSGKPEPDLILGALERLSVSAPEACYVGDSIYDLEASAAAHVYFIGYKRSGDSRIDHLTDLLKL